MATAAHVHKGCTLCILGRARRPLNFLIRNRWESIKQIRKAAKVPILLLSSLKVRYPALDALQRFGTLPCSPSDETLAH